MAGVVGAVAVTLLTSACGPGDGTGSGAAGAGPGGEPSTSSSTSSTRAARAPVRVPVAGLAAALGCPAGIAVAVAHRVELPTAQPSVVVVAHCQSAAGSPPDGVYVVSGIGTARLSGTLVGVRDQVEVSTLVRVGDRLRMTGRGYSSSDVPRCCPDLAVTRSWRVVGDSLVAVT